MRLFRGGGFISGLVKGFRTGDWNEAFISGEKIAVGKVASVMVTVAFSAMAVNPIGIVGFAVIMAVTSALITDERLKQLNSFINGI
ncbi:colicin-like pore-forming protein [Escherichia coli]|uniref:colicin-like pore-forming protein n=1 Tax=Escherichia coli TaxID=562 RepID=UPI003C2AEB0A